MNLQHASVTRAFWRYTLPSLAALLVSGTYQIIDGVFVGHFIGGDGLAAISLAWPLVGALLSLGMMIGIGAGAHASIQIGARQLKHARAYVAQSLVLIALISVIGGVGLFLVSNWFLQLQGAQEQVLQYGQAYLNWLLAGSPLVVASIALPLLVRNSGAPGLATLAMVFGAVANTFFDALFIVVLGFGLEGAAFATLLGELGVVAICLNFLFSKRSLLPLRWNLLQWDINRAKQILQTGFSSMLMYMYLSFSIVLHNTLLLRYGSNVHVAAYSIAGYILAFYYLMAEGIAGGMQPITSFYKGARLFQR